VQGLQIFPIHGEDHLEALEVAGLNYTRPALRQVIAAADSRLLRAGVEEELDEVCAAQECFVTSATSFVKAVVEVDGKRIGGGQPGPVSRRLRDIYVEAARAEARAGSVLAGG